MATTINRLTDKTIRAIKEAGLYHDGAGLYLQVTGDGAKSWVMRYSLRGKAHGMGLGSFRHVSLAEARAERDKYQKLLRDHIDPILHRAQQRAANVREQTSSITFREAAGQCLPIFTQNLTNAKHAAQWTSTIETYALPVIGNLMVRDISAHDVLRVVKPLWTAKGETASRVRARIEKILDWAQVHGYCSGANPARWQGNLELMLGDRKKGQHHAALSYDELPAFMTKLRQENGTAARALEFCILTAARTGEVILAGPDEINVPDALWAVPPEHMKTKKPHLVPLCNRALELVSGAKDRFLFPNPDNNEAELSDKAMLRLLERMGYGHVTTHGFRSTFKDWATDKTGFEYYISEAALGHASGDKTEQAYSRSTFIEKRRRLMDSWAAFCDGSDAVGDNVTQLRR